MILVADKLLFRFYNQQGNDIETLLTANKRSDAEGRVTGVLCFLHVARPELQYAMQVQKKSKQVAANYHSHFLRTIFSKMHCNLSFDKTNPPKASTANHMKHMKERTIFLGAIYATMNIKKDNKLSKQKNTTLLKELRASQSKNDRGCA